MYVELKYISDLQAELLILKLISINLAPFLLKLELYWSENLLVCLILFKIIICMVVCTLLFPQTQPLLMFIINLSCPAGCFEYFAKIDKLKFSDPFELFIEQSYIQV